LSQEKDEGDQWDGAEEKNRPFPLHLHIIAACSFSKAKHGKSKTARKSHQVLPLEAAGFVRLLPGPGYAKLLTNSREDKGTEMKRLTILLLVAACSLIQLVPAAPVVQNGGFETADLSNWTYSGNYEVSSLDPHAGAQSAHFASADLATLEQVVAVVPGGTYELSFSLANFAGGENSFVVSFGGHTLDSVADTAAFGYTTVRLSNLTATTPSAALSFAFSGSAWAIDEVKLIRTDQLLENGGFELGSYSGWQRSSNNWTPPSTNHVAEGSYAGRLGSKDGNSGWRGELWQTVETEAGRDYEVSFWLKSPGYGFKELTASFAGQDLFDYARNDAPVPYGMHAGWVRATGSTADLRFAENNQGFWYLDGVSVSLVALPDISLAEAITHAPAFSAPDSHTEIAAAPEPRSLGLLAAGLALVTVAAEVRRRREGARSRSLSGTVAEGRAA
jgi:hypothetical protein